MNRPFQKETDIHLAERLVLYEDLIVSMGYKKDHVYDFVKDRRKQTIEEIILRHQERQ